MAENNTHVSLPPPAASRQRPFLLNVNTKAAASTNKAPSLSSASSCSSADSPLSPEQPSTPIALSSSGTLGNGRSVPFLQSSPPTFAASPPSLVLTDFPDGKHAIPENDGFLSINDQTPAPGTLTPTVRAAAEPFADDWLLVHASPTSISATSAGISVTTPRRVLFEKTEAGEEVLDWERGSKFSLETVAISASGQNIKGLRLKNGLETVASAPNAEVAATNVDDFGIAFQEGQQLVFPLGNFRLSEPNSKRGPRLLGNGAWSNVYLGELVPFPDTGLSGGPLAVAVKQPLNDFSKRTIRHEAKILSYLYKINSRSKATLSVVEFYGFEEASHSILMNYIPGPRMDRFIADKVSENERNPSNLTLRLPIIGTRQWIFMAEKLVQAFQYLKDSGVIHGDIKPHNIFLREWTHQSNGEWWGSIDEKESKTGLWEPIVGDFSSSFIVDSNGLISDDEEPVSAVTKTYCAPELLQAFTSRPVTPNRPPSSSSSQTLSEVSHSNHLSPLSASRRSLEPRPIPTFASDLYSVGITLLQMAIGSHPYSDAHSEYQKNAWIQQGDPFAFARNGLKIFKCMKGGIVDRSLKGCFGKTSDGRTTIETLGERLSVIGGEWRAQMAQGNDSWVWGQ